MTGFAFVSRADGMVVATIPLEDVDGVTAALAAGIPKLPPEQRESPARFYQQLRQAAEQYRRTL